MQPSSALARLVFLSAATLACNGDSLPEPVTGTLVVATETSGIEPDLDGYTVQVDAQPVQSVGSSGALTGTDVTSGDHVVQLGGVAANCAVTGDNPRTITIVSGETTTATFSVTCVATALVPRIVFQGGDSRADILLVNADGSRLQQLTTGGNNQSPFWSRDGSRIFFYRAPGPAGGSSVLSSMKPDGNDLQSHSAVPPGEGEQWSLDGKRRALAAYSADPSGVQRDLYTENADGTERIRIVDLPSTDCGGITDCKDVASVAWSPAGDWIAYTTYVGGRALAIYGDLLLVSPDGTQHRTLAQGMIDGPEWSPDGLRLAFSSGATSLIPAPMNVEVIDATGANRSVVVDGSRDATYNWDPSWSADGTYLTFSRSPVGHPELGEIFIVNLDGTGLRRVAGASGGAFAPDLSPERSAQ